jgi:hypothetical protein
LNQSSPLPMSGAAIYEKGDSHEKDGHMDCGRGVWDGIDGMRIDGKAERLCVSD